MENEDFNFKDVENSKEDYIKSKINELIKEYDSDNIDIHVGLIGEEEESKDIKDFCKKLSLVIRKYKLGCGVQLNIKSKNLIEENCDEIIVELMYQIEHNKEKAEKCFNIIISETEDDTKVADIEFNCEDNVEVLRKTIKSVMINVKQILILSKILRGISKDTGRKDILTVNNSMLDMLCCIFQSVNDRTEKIIDSIHDRYRLL